MAKKIRNAVLVCLLLAFCTLIFTACNGGLLGKHSHEFSGWKMVSAATCLQEGREERTCKCGEIENKAIAKLSHVEETLAATEPDCTTAGKTEGSRCSACQTTIVEQQTIPMLGHSFDLENHVCKTCQDTLPSIASRNDFLEYQGASDAVILLDKCIDSSNTSEQWTLTIAPDVQHVRLIGDPEKKYNLRIVVDPAREKAMTVDLIDVALVSSQKAPVIQSGSTQELSVCFYGTDCSLVARSGDAGKNGSLLKLSMHGDNGGNGELAIQAAGAVRLLVAADSVAIKGGNGGMGGNGMDAAPAPQDGGNGGNGGNGAQAIEASSIDVYAVEGYEANSIVLRGGYGGEGGNGGAGFLFGDRGSNGKTGASATATSVSPTYH